MSTKRYRILIVDKNDGASFVLNSILSNWNYEVLVVNSFLKAIEYSQLEQNRPNLIIVDIQELSQIFYEFPKKMMERTGKDIPIIVNTTITNPIFIEKSISSGYYDYFIRPMDPEVLRSKILNILTPNENILEKSHFFQLEEESTLLSKIKLLNINEYKIESISHFPIRPGSMVTIQSEILKDLGIDQVELKVVDLKKRDKLEPEDEYPYKLELAFVGLKSEDFFKLKKLATGKGEVAAA